MAVQNGLGLRFIVRLDGNISDGNALTSGLAGRPTTWWEYQHRSTWIDGRKGCGRAFSTFNNVACINEPCGAVRCAWIVAAARNWLCDWLWRDGVSRLWEWIAIEQKQKAPLGEMVSEWSRNGVGMESVRRRASGRILLKQYCRSAVESAVGEMQVVEALRKTQKSMFKTMLFGRQSFDQYTASNSSSAIYSFIHSANKLKN